MKFSLKGFTNRQNLIMIFLFSMKRSIFFHQKQNYHHSVWLMKFSIKSFDKLKKINVDILVFNETEYIFSSKTKFSTLSLVDEILIQKFWQIDKNKCWYFCFQWNIFFFFHRKKILNTQFGRWNSQLNILTNWQKLMLIFVFNETEYVFSSKTKFLTLSLVDEILNQTFWQIDKNKCWYFCFHWKRHSVSPKTKLLTLSLIDEILVKKFD